MHVERTTSTPRQSTILGGRETRDCDTPNTERVTTLGVNLTMPALIAIIIIIIVIWAAFKYWYVTLGLAVLGAIIYAIVQANEAREREDAAEAERKAKELADQERYRSEQTALRRRMSDMGAQSLDAFEKLPTHLSLAEQYLDRAQVDFAERAFAPFWDCVESTAKQLGHFDEGVRRIKTNTAAYSELITEYASSPPPFPLAQRSVERLSVASSTAKRMGNVVRNAQRDFQFATIYEQRKTNQILVAGFTNLAHALDQMTWQITASIDDLSKSVHVMTGKLDQSLGAINSTMSELREQGSAHHLQLMDQATNAAARETKALVMLDNIQRGRRPA
jgi:uncharacterized protein YfcZ (UPF0381/DUF406 family)